MLPEHLHVASFYYTTALFTVVLLMAAKGLAYKFSC